MNLRLTTGISRRLPDELADRQRPILSLQLSHVPPEFLRRTGEKIEMRGLAFNSDFRTTLSQVSVILLTVSASHSLVGVSAQVTM